MKRQRKNWLICAAAATAALSCVGLSGCSTAGVSQRKVSGELPKPSLIYVCDFELESAQVKGDSGLLPAPPKLPGPLGDKLPPLPGSAKDPAQVAAELVDTMSASLVKNLNKAGFKAQRLARGAAYPESGWLIRGVFTEVNQGNRLQRAVIGFGTGKTDLQVVVDVNDLALGMPRTFYELTTTANSGQGPGAAPALLLNPAAAGARFVVAGEDLNRNVKQTAARIAAELVERTQRAAESPAPGLGKVTWVW